jgi:NitT/TauT family transport system substrate-binding protein
MAGTVNDKVVSDYSEDLQRARNRWGVWVIVLFMLGGLIFFYYANKKDALRISYNSTAIASAPVLVAIDAELGSALKLRLLLDPNSTGRFALQKLIGGQADVATVADVPVVNGSVSHSDLRIILIICKSPIHIVARKSKIKTVHDLAGKKIGTFDGTSARYFLDRELAMANVAPDEIVNMTPTDAVTALQNDSVDAISSWEPQARFAADLLGPDAQTLPVKQDSYIERFNIVTTADKLKDPKKRDAIIRFVRILMEASGKIYERPGDTKTMVSRDLGMESQQLTSVWPEFDFPANIPTSDSIKIESDNLLKSLVEIEKINAKADKRPARDENELERLIDTSIWEEAKRRADERAKQ